MFTTAAPITIAPLMNDKVQYDPRKDFVPIAVVAVMPVWLVVNANSPLKSAADIVRKAKDNPGKLNYGTSGVGTELHLAAEAVSRSAGIQMVHVPFRGGGEVIAALLGNQLDFAALSTASIAGPLKQGSLRALAVSSPQRMADFPEVPTFAEIGHPGATMMPWWGLMAPAGTPPAVVAAADAGAGGDHQGRGRARTAEGHLRADRFRRPAGVRAASRDRDRALWRHHPRRQHQARASDMKRSSDRIRTTHAGRLPVPPGLENLPVRLYLGEVVDPAVIAEGIAHGVRKQLDLGIDCIGDGEFWKARDFIYYSRHLTGIERRPLKPGETGSTRTHPRARRVRAVLQGLDKAGTIFYVPGERPTPPERECTVARGPIKSKGRRRWPRRSRRSRRRSPGPGGRWTRRSSA